MGDLCEDGQSYAHWNNWFAAAKGVIDTIPEMPVQGNHETYNLGWKPPTGSNNQPFEFVTQFKVPQNGPVSGAASLKGTVYSYDYGDVHFAYLNSQDVELAADGTLGFSGTLFLDMQKAWLDNDLKSTTKKWKIVLFHKTPYYNKANRTNEDVKAAFLPIIDKYHADIVFNGHDHGVSRTYPMNNDTFVANPAQGTVYYVTGRSGNKYYSDLFKKVWDASLTSDGTDMPTYIVAQADSMRLTLKAYKQNGTLIDSYSISKQAGGSESDTPATALPAKYTNTRLVVYGDAVTDTSTVPKQINGKWYIPLKIFTQANANCTYSSTILPAHYASTIPTYDDTTTTGVITISKLANISGSTLKFTVNSTNASVGTTGVTLANPITTDAITGAAIIAADDLVKVLTAAAPSPYKFTYKYDANFNMLHITEDQSAF